MRTCRGYLSFLLLIPLSLLLLLPFLARPVPPAPTAFYAVEQASLEQIALKRALLVSAHQTILDLRAQPAISPTSLAYASMRLGCAPPTTDAAVPFSQLTLLEQDCLARHEVLRAWSQLRMDWDAHSPYDAQVRCADLTDSLSLSSALPSLFFTLPTPDAPSPSWAACASHLSWSRVSSSLSIQPGFTISLQHKNLPINATSPLASLEVGG
jgi:hypothetical protein